jgi:hypothetical protein
VVTKSPTAIRFEKQIADIDPFEERMIPAANATAAALGANQSPVARGGTSLKESVF